MRSTASQAGFTLVEILIAMFVFSVLFAMATAGVTMVLTADQQVEENAKRLEILQKTFNIMTRDIEHAVNRPIRNEFGDPAPPLTGGRLGPAALELTRSSWDNPLLQKRSTLQRAAYVLRDEELVRVTWSALDRPIDGAKTERVLLRQVDELNLRFLDANNVWHDQWPPANNAPGQSSVPLPVGIEVSLELAPWGEIKRLFRVPESWVPGASPTPPPS